MKEIVDESGLNEAMAASNERPVFLFKHSTACPVSATAYREVERYVKSGGEGVREVYLVKVIESRPVSNAIAKQTGVGHASPQIILVDDGKAVWDASHYKIVEDALAQAAGAGE